MKTEHTWIEFEPKNLMVFHHPFASDNFFPKKDELDESDSLNPSFFFYLISRALKQSQKEAKRSQKEEKVGRPH